MCTVEIFPWMTGENGGVALFGNICILALYIYGLATFQWR